MSWQEIGDVSAATVVACLVAAVLLQVRAGRWILGALVVLFYVLMLFSDNHPNAFFDFSADFDSKLISHCFLFLRGTSFLLALFSFAIR